MGEQMHKPHKGHAPHTNSRDTELQLMKDYNVSQSLRFVAAGAHGDCEAANQIRGVLDKCPMLGNSLRGERGGGNQTYPLAN